MEDLPPMATKAAPPMTALITAYSISKPHPHYHAVHQRVRHLIIQALTIILLLLSLKLSLSILELLWKQAYVPMSAEDVHKYGTDDGWHGVIEKGGQFPPEKDRYHLYIGTNHFIAILITYILPYSLS